MKSNGTSRRSFLSAGLMLPVVGAGARLGFASPSVGLPHPGEEASNTLSGRPAKLQYRTLGKTGLKVTTLGFGCMITSDPSVIERALDAGINYFDTSRNYQHGNNERMVGAALGMRRKDIVLSTKTEASDKQGMLDQLETSLRELKTDYVDIWYLHGKDKPEQITSEMIEVQQQAKKEGKIRFAGVSTHGGQQQLLPWMAKSGAFDVALTAYNFAMDPGMEQAIDAAAQAGIGIVGMKVMAGGFKSIRPSDPLFAKMKRDGAMLAALKWVLKKPQIATTIPGMTDMDQLEENLRAMAEPFAHGDQKVLEAHLETIKPLYCRMCGQCDGTCQQGLPVADVLRILTYADGYRQFALGRERYQQLAPEHRAASCGDCDSCTVNCPYGVKVSERVARAQELFA